MAGSRDVTRMACCRTASLVLRPTVSTAVSRIIVEIDGGTHSTDEEIAYDKSREAYLRAQGFRIFRAHNGEVYENIDGVCDTLLAFIRGETD